MAKHEYEQRFMVELEDMWNSGARFQFINWNDFVASMWQENERQIDEYNA